MADDMIDGEGALCADMSACVATAAKSGKIGSEPSAASHHES